MNRVSVVVSVLAIIVLGLVAARGPSTTAHDASRIPEGHPLVGTWLVDTDVTTETDAPAIAVWGADGSFIDPSEGFAGVIDPSEGFVGVWEATGPRTGTHTFMGPLDERGSGFLLLTSSLQVDASGDRWEAPYSFMIVAADGAILQTGSGMSTATRLKIVPEEMIGTPQAGLPTWVSEAPAASPPA